MWLIALFLNRFRSQQLPDHFRSGAGFGDVFASQFGLTLSHLDIGATENLRELVEIAKIHHVPGCEGITQIVEPEVLNRCSSEQVFEAPLQSLASALRALFRG